MTAGRRQKGAYFSIAFFFLIGLIVVVSAWLFFIFFKVHITSIAVDVDSINRYQEIPTTLLTTTVYAGDEKCRKGDGPIGPAEKPNYDLCTKKLPIIFSAGGKILSGPESPGVDGVYTSSEFRNDLELALPENCYSVLLKSATGEDVLKAERRTQRAPAITQDCDMKSPRLTETYPIPIFSGGVPAVAEQTITIGSTNQGEEILVRWPRYKTCLTDDEDCKVNEPQQPGSSGQKERTVK